MIKIDCGRKLSKVFNATFGPANVLFFLVGIIFANGICRAQQSETEYRNESWSQFAYLSCFEYDPLRHAQISFAGNDTFYAKVHSNDNIHIFGNLYFMKRVTTSGDIEPHNNYSVFEEGSGFRKPIIFPNRAEEIREYNGIFPTLGTFNPDSLTQLVLSGSNIYVRSCGPDTLENGEIVITCVPPTISEAPLYPIPNSGAVFVNGKVWLSASRGLPDISDPTFISLGFSGQLTIATSDTLIIEDNIIYHNARQNATIPPLDSCSDILGLISENCIMIGKDSRRTVYINAALAALNGAISVQDIYENHAPGWDNEKQSLQIYGAMAQRYRGIMHTTDYPPGHYRGFIEKDYKFDLRLIDNPPPHYPKTENNN